MDSDFRLRGPVVDGYVSFFFLNLFFFFVPVCIIIITFPLRRRMRFTKWTIIGKRAKKKRIERMKRFISVIILYINTDFNLIYKLIKFYEITDRYIGLNIFNTFLNILKLYLSITLNSRKISHFIVHDFFVEILNYYILVYILFFVLLIYFNRSYI